MPQAISDARASVNPAVQGFWVRAVFSHRTGTEPRGWLAKT
jgi:hypothetical protein